MADKTPEQEPSIEEILASIRQIISDDDEKETRAAPQPDVPASPPPPKMPEPVFETRVDVAAPPEDDILELTDPLPDEDEEEFEEEEQSYDIDLQEFAPEAVDAAPAAPPPAAPPAPPKAEPAMEDILTDAARHATLSSMAKLAGNMPVTRHREYGNITLEDLVREMLHPMLKDWLSESLPPIVERIVQRELEKLARQAQDV